MIQSDQPLPVTRRCELLKVARSTAYCRPGPVSHEDVVLMRLIDEIHAGASWGGDGGSIHTAVGKVSGRGGPLTHRSGCAV